MTPFAWALAFLIINYDMKPSEAIQQLEILIETLEEDPSQ